MKKIISLFLAVIMMISIFAFAPISANATQTDTSNFLVCGDYLYSVLSDGTAESVDYKGDANTLIIPSTLDEYKVSSIGDYAFWGCSSLISVTIPSSVRSIGQSSFSACDRLKSITIPNSVKTIYYYAFSGCTSLTSINIPASVTTLGHPLFNSCDNLSTITVHKNNWCFDSRNNCNGIIYKNSLIAGCKNTVIPNTVTSIGTGAFYDCKGLTAITIPDSVTSIGKTAFYGCSSLMSLAIPDSVTSIGDWAFGHCNQLTSIIVPSSVTNIEDNAFYNCGSFADILTLYVYEASYAHQYAIENNIPYEIIGCENGMRVYSDSGNLAVNVGDEITVGVSVVKGYSEQTDASKVTYTVADSSVVKPVSTEIRGKVHYVKFKGLKAGKTTVTFSDSITGTTVQVPITVFNVDSATFTLKSFKAYENGTYLTNMYNLCGLFADNYDYEVYNDGSADLSFDVYNSSFIYGAVEVYDAKGQLVDAQVIDKYKENGGSFKGIVYDNGSYLIHDIANGNLFSDTYYKSKISTAHTHIKVTIPKNGYIKVSMDPTKSVIVNAVNGTDMMLQCADLLETISGYAKNDDLPPTLARTVVESATKPGDDKEMLKALAKNIPQDGKMTPQSTERFLKTYAKNMRNTDLREKTLELIVDLEFATFEEASKLLDANYGKAIELIFMASDFVSLQNQYMDFTSNIGTGTLTILNQEGNSRTENDVTVKCKTDFADNTAIKVFEMTPQSELLTNIKAQEPDLYEAMRKNFTYTYEIKMVKDGEVTQPDEEVEVYIPIPADLLTYTSSGKITVKHIKDDGTAEDMNAKIDGNYIVFTTTHFSKFMVAYMGDSEQLTKDMLDYTFGTHEDGTATLLKYTGTDTKIAIPSVYDGYVVTAIASGAFDDSNITIVEIPDSVSEIADGVFENIDCTLGVYTDSYAYEYVVENDIKYIVVDAIMDTLLGDVDGDGKISVVDATVVQRHLAEIEILTEEQLVRADTYKDSKISILDATQIQRLLAEIITEF